MLTEEQMIEIGARALHPRGASETDPAYILEFHNYCRDQVRAVLAALRAAGVAVAPLEPNEAMIDAGIAEADELARTAGHLCQYAPSLPANRQLWDEMRERVAVAYRAMIRAAQEPDNA